VIRYLLRCGEGHEFDGWFPGSAAFDEQTRRRLLSCPQCGIGDVTRALMAPAIQTRAFQPASGQPISGRSSSGQPSSGQPSLGRPSSGHAPSSPPPPAEGSVIPAVAMAALQKLRQHVEQHCENLGDRFAEEALKIHRGEGEARGIYGQASEEDRHRLADEGVEIMALPWVRRADS
jgi:hypothetical protein